MVKERGSNMRRKIVFFLGLLVMVVSSFAWRWNKKEDKKMNTTVIYANYDYDVNNIVEVVKNVDCIFVGTVISIDGYNYENPVEMELEDGTIYVQYDTYTKYTIDVKDVIQGELTEGINGDIIKFGGVEYGGESIAILANDILPDIGDEYIFMGYMQDDGTILISGENSNISVRLYEQIVNVVRSK